MYTVGSGFAGQDGIALAMMIEGFAIRWQVEINEWCRKLLAKRFPRSQIFEDIRNVGSHNLKPVDLICGGFPCQDISTAGYRAGLNGTRSGLWYEFARVISELRPAIVFLENVDEITAPIRERGTGRIVDRAPGFAVLGSLAEMGFDAQWGIVSASAAGAPHQRDRWWCVAWSISNANRIRQQKQESKWRLASHQERHASPQSARRQTIVHETFASGESLKLGHTNRIRLQAERQVGQQGTLARSEQSQPEGASYRAGLVNDDQPDVGRIVFDGLSHRLERLASAQLYAAPFGARPHSYEPPRLTTDNYDWEARVTAIGNSVCRPVVSAFAPTLRQALDTLYT